MTISRRSFGLGVAGVLATPAAMLEAIAQQAQPHTPAAVQHEMNSMPAHWVGREQIAFLIYPQFTALDMVGPHYMLSNLMGATTHIVAKSKDIVRSDTGLLFAPTANFDECPANLDIICIPGGSAGTLAAMNDEATLRFIKDRGSRAKFVTSVCTGSLLLGAAGLLEGYKATSHWVTKDILKVFGATPTDGRIVTDRNRITGGGVTAGIDFGLSLVAMMRDTQYAQAVQLLGEYAPEPPFNAGRPDTAPAEVKAIMDGMFANFIVEAESVGKAAYAKSRSL